MTTVVILTYVGSNVRERLVKFFGSKKPTRKITPKKRRIVKIWRKYGIVGVAFLTPLLLTPPGGTLIALSFKEKKQQIILYMLASSIFWSLILTKIVELFGVSVVKEHLSLEAVSQWFQGLFQ